MLLLLKKKEQKRKKEKNFTNTSYYQKAIMCKDRQKGFYEHWPQVNRLYREDRGELIHYFLDLIAGRNRRLLLQQLFLDF